MKVPFRIRKVVEAAPATGLLLWSDASAELLALLADLDTDPLPLVFAVSGGYLVKLAAPARCAFPGVSRLRRLADDLFLPVDAVLLPTLFNDEAAGLVRKRGLVFLPNGRVLGYDPTRPLQLASLLTIARIRRRAWHAPPQLPERADRLLSILFDRPNDTPDAVLIPDGPPIGTEEPRPEDAGFLSRLSGKTAFGAGMGMVWLGKLFGWKGLAKLGAGLVQSAVQWVPRLSESVLGRQEAALRELLRLFRAGRMEDALRRALPFGGEGGRGGKAATDAILPTHNTTYSLGSLLGDGAPPSIWFGGGDVMTDLAQAYRKAAEEATARGDFRRAAFIYGKLLSDYSAAAAVLARGGLHHDAAILYLEKLGDPMTAAREFEADGEFDRALQIYRQRGEHVAAGDLLLCIGEEEEAVCEFILAAKDHADAGDYLTSGELLLKKARRRDLALDQFRLGWALRPIANTVPCAIRLAQLLAEEEAPRALVALVREAELAFLVFGSDKDASQFFNEIARLADRPNLAAMRDDLLDRALFGVANKLRQRAEEETRPGDLVSLLLSHSAVWTPAVVSDADIAFRAAVLTTKEKPASRNERAVSRLRLGEGAVTAVCAANTGVLFVGFQTGALVCFDPAKSGVLPVLPKSGVDTIDVATTPGGEMVVALRGNPYPETELALAQRQADKWLFSHSSRLPAGSTYRLTPMILDRSEPVLGLWDGKRGRLLRGVTLACTRSFDGSELGIDLETICDIVLLPPANAKIDSRALKPGSTVIDTCAISGAPLGEYSLALLDDRDLWWQSPKDRCWHKTPLGWAVRLGSDWPPRQGSLLKRDEEGWNVTVFRLGIGGRLYTARLCLVDDEWVRVDSAATSEAGYSATAILGSKKFAGVRSDGIHWLRIDPTHAHSLRMWDATRVPLEGAVSCFAMPRTQEVAVVLRDGWLVRVPAPH